MVRLKELRLDDGKKIYDMLQGIEKEKNGFHNEANGLTYEEFKIYLKKNKKMAEGKELPEGYVPQTLYWLWIEDKVVGMGKLRHYLNDNLRKKGGHAAYAVCKSERKKGYGKIILRELIKEAKGKGIDRLLVTCVNDNIASRKIIETNNGILEGIEDGECKYWIDVQ